MEVSSVHFLSHALNEVANMLKSIVKPKAPNENIYIYSFSLSDKEETTSQKILTQKLYKNILANH